MADQSTQPLFILSRVRAQGAIGLVTVDVESNEAITYASDITQHPVEEGYDATDNSRPRPPAIQAECFVTNTPLSAADTVRIGGPNDGKVHEVPDYADRVLAQLIDIQNTGTLVTVITTRGSFPSMMITNVTVNTDTKTFNGLKFSIAFSYFRVVKNKLTRNVITKDHRPPAKVNKGAVVPEQTPAAKRKSALKSIGKFVDNLKSKAGF